MYFKEMDQEKLRTILSQEEDVLTERSAEDAKFYDNVSCLRCGGTCTIEAHVQGMVRAGTTRNKYMCRCTECGCLFEPHMGIIIEMGNLGRLTRPYPLIHDDD
jgi:hypothetical protein